jgi:hypothetical protein
VLRMTGASRRRVTKRLEPGEAKGLVMRALLGSGAEAAELPQSLGPPGFDLGPTDYELAQAISACLGTSEVTRRSTETSVVSVGDRPVAWATGLSSTSRCDRRFHDRPLAVEHAVDAALPADPVPKPLRKRNRAAAVQPEAH